MSTELLVLSELRPGDRITGVIRPDQTVVDKRNWVVKAPWGPHPTSDAWCLQMQSLPGHPEFEFNLWACDLELTIGFWVTRPD